MTEQDLIPAYSLRPTLNQAIMDHPDPDVTDRYITNSKTNVIGRAKRRSTKSREGVSSSSSKKKKKNAPDGGVVLDQPKNRHENNNEGKGLGVTSVLEQQQPDAPDTSSFQVRA